MAKNIRKFRNTPFKCKSFIHEIELIYMNIQKSFICKKLLSCSFMKLFFTKVFSYYHGELKFVNFVFKKLYTGSKNMRLTNLFRSIHKISIPQKLHALRYNIHSNQSIDIPFLFLVRFLNFKAFNECFKIFFANFQSHYYFLIQKNSLFAPS